ncbi:hypothetical protein VV867_06555 [Pseudomonas sp. JH-2]|nr:hypothetical protein [Pseudomonas sp. JH-2]
MLGEVPLKDFMSYDPGRYYWSAAVMSIMGGNGIVYLRVAISIFQFLGLFCGVYLVARSRPSLRGVDGIFLLFAAAVFVLWMFPRHKLFDISISIFLVGILACLASARTPRHYFGAGVGIGLIAFLGRNHGLYGAVASLAIMLWLLIGEGARDSAVKKMFSWSIGVVVGYTPMLFLILFVPGFEDAFLNGVKFQVSRGATNFPLPVPWPWLVSFSTSSWLESLRAFWVGVLFVSLLIFGIFSILWVFFERLRGRSVPAVFVGAAFLSLPYAHYAYSRADTGHLSQGIFPLLIGCLLLIFRQNGKRKVFLLLGLLTISLIGGGANQPGWNCSGGNRCDELVVAGDKLEVDSATAKNVQFILDLAEKYSGGHRAFIATPYWPGAYAVLGDKSPLWANYALWSRGVAFEQEEIERIKAANPGVIIVVDIPLDGRDELRFRNTNPHIYEYIVENFHALPNSDDRCPSCRVFVAKDFPGEG